MAFERQAGNKNWVTVLPVTHRAPQESAAGVAMPLAIERHFGLDDDRFWVVLSEGDQLV